MRTITTHKFRAHWLWVVPFLLITTGLASRHLLTDTYWFDELANLWKMGVPPYPSATLMEIVTNIGLTQWVPAYNFALLPWGAVAGWSEFSSRVLSLFMAVISVASMYRLGTTFANRRVGFIGVVLLSTSQFFIFYAHEMRGYMQYLMLTIMVLTLYWRQAKQAQQKWKDGVLFVGLSIILIYTHYVALYVMTGLGLYHLFLAPKVNQWGKRLRWLIYVGASFIPWVAIAFINAVHETGRDRGLDVPTILQTTFYGFGNGFSLPFLILIIYAIIVIRNRSTTMLTFCGITFIIFSLITNVMTDFLFHIRHIIGILPILLVLSAIAIHDLINKSKGIAWGLIVVWAVVGIWLNNDLTFMEDMPGALKNHSLTTMSSTVETLNECATENDFVVTHLSLERHIWNTHVEQFYFEYPDYSVATLENLADYSKVGWDEVITEGTYDERLANIMETSDRVWIPIDDKAYSTPQLSTIGEALANNYAYCGEALTEQGVTIYVYQNEAEFTCNTNAQTLPTCAPDLLTSYFSEGG